MACTPLFHTTLLELQKCARASDIPTGSDAMCAVESASRAASVHIQTAMGFTETNRLMAIADACPPTSEDELKRARLKLVEEKVFTAELMCSLRFLAVDGSSMAFDEYDCNSPYRQMDQADTDALVKKLMADANSLLADAGATTVANSIGHIVIGPSGCPIPLYSRPKDGPLIYGSRSRHHDSHGHPRARHY